MSVISRIIDSINFYRLKKEFDKISRLVLDNANVGVAEKRSFSDGTPYSTEEVERRVLVIQEKLQKLTYWNFSREQLGVLYTLINNETGYLNIGIEKWIQLYDKEPEYIRNVVFQGFNEYDTFNKSDFFKKYNSEMSIDSILTDWFEITAKGIEIASVDEFVFDRDDDDNVLAIHTERYGQNFIKAYPQFFVEDRDLPQEIKVKFYESDLSIDEYFQYKEQFEGIFLGAGVVPGVFSGIASKHYDALLKYDIEAMKYIQSEYFGDAELRRGIAEIGKANDEDFEVIKSIFQRIINAVLSEAKEDVLEGTIDAPDLGDVDFVKTRLPELFLDDDAPETLKKFFYDGSLDIGNLIKHPDWIKWLEGKDEYVKAQCILNPEYSWWAHEREEISDSKVKDYVSILYEDEIREDIIRGENRDSLITPVFKARNQDIFFDDLPRKIRRHFEERDWSMEDYFALSPRIKELLKDKLIYMAFSDSEEVDLCKKYGSDYGAFEIYEKYAGLMNIMAHSAVFRSEDQGLEEFIKEKTIVHIMTGRYQYDDRVPEEYKKTNSKHFLSEDAPEELKEIFYRNNSENMTFEMLRHHPEYMSFLEGKFVKKMFEVRYNDFFNFCSDQDEAMELGIKYGDYVTHLSLPYLSISKKNRASFLEGTIYESIKKNDYDHRDLPKDFQLKYPELFLNEEDLQKLSNLSEEEREKFIDLFYKKQVSFNLLREYPDLVDIIKSKDLCIILNGESEYLLSLFNNDKNEVIYAGVKYGDILLDKEFKKYFIHNVYGMEYYSHIEKLDFLIYSSIVEEGVCYDDSLPEDFKVKYPELFILEEEKEKIPSDIVEAFYERRLSLLEIGSSPEVREIIKNKNLSVCGGQRRGRILDRFTQATSGNRERAFDLVTGKFAGKLEEIEGNYTFSKDLEKCARYYEEGRFIPDMAVVYRLPEDKIKNFALNRKLWGRLVKSREELSVEFGREHLLSLLEAAIVMGVFETKEFTRNGETRIQGNGEEGFKKLQSLLDYAPKYTLASEREYIDKGDLVEGYLKVRGDYSEELIYEILKYGAEDSDISESFFEGDLDEYDVDELMEYLEKEDIAILVEDCFREDEDGCWSCILDRRIDEKIMMLLKTTGIKDSEVLFKDEFEILTKSDSRFIKEAFKVTSKQRFKFNIAQKGDKFIIGENEDIDEEQSKANKRLYDYVRFLMMEYGLEPEAARLGAQNDRSNIELYLDKEKMEILCNAADRISSAAVNGYSDLCLLKRTFDGELFVTNDILHQLFDGMQMEYNQEFSEFLLKNIRDIIGDTALNSKICAIQEKIIEVSKDPDYAGREITPAMVLRAMNRIEYSNKKVGFEKGEDLAQIFAFSQEYFDAAQKVWEDARKREGSIIPRIEGKEGNYTYEVLRLDDVTGIFAGNLTSCCQKLGGVGETAMLHSMQEKTGRVFIIRDARRKIVAQSWLWRNGNTICFDNLEIPRNMDSHENQEAVYDILKKVAKEFCKEDSKAFDELVRQGKIDEDMAQKSRVTKVTVGKKNTDVYAISGNTDRKLEDDECKFPIERGKIYEGIDSDDLYVSDSRAQVILYRAKEHIKTKVDTMYILYGDENIEKSFTEMIDSDLETVRAIEEEVEGQSNMSSISEVLQEYGKTAEELKLILGTDWFMLYSEGQEEVVIHKLLKSPSSGILKKSVKEQKEAIKMLMGKGKEIKTEVETERIHRTMKYIEKRNARMAGKSEGR